MKISIVERVLSGRKVFTVMFITGRTRKIRSFATLAEAEASRELLAAEHKKSGAAYIELSYVAKEEMLVAYNMAKEHSLSVLASVRMAISRKKERVRQWGIDVETGQSAMPMSQAISKFVVEKRVGGLRPRTLDSLESSLYRFLKSSGNCRITAIDRSAVRKWLDGANVETATRNNMRNDLLNFFGWAKQIHLIEDSPMDSVKKYKETLGEEKKRMLYAPMIFTPEQAAELLAGVHARKVELLPYAVLLLFAGLRPSREAAHIAWPHVHFKGEANEHGVIEDSDYIEVGGWTTKNRQAREVPMAPNMRAWMKLCKDMNIPLPYGDDTERDWVLLRRKLGFVDARWQPDCARHSYASYHLTAFQNLDATRTCMGHGNSEMLFRHYRRVVAQSVALRFWSLTPESVLTDTAKAPVSIGVSTLEKT